MLWASLVLSSIAAVIVLATALCKNTGVAAGIATALLIGSFGIAGLIMGLFPTLSGFLFLLVIVLVVAAVFAWRRWRVVVAVCLCFLISHGFSAVHGGLRLSQELKSNPLVSLESRMPPRDEEVVGNPARVSDLQALYDQVAPPQVVRGEAGVDRTNYHASLRDGFLRAAALQELHGATFQRFVNSPGFGVSRLSTPLNRSVDPTSGDTPSQRSPHSDRSYFQPENDMSEKMPGSVIDQLRLLNRKTHINFAYPFDFGFLARHRVAAGFIPHQYRSDRISVEPIRGDLDSDPFRAERVSRDRILRLELVSLLKFETPAVYVSEQFPRMEQFADVPTRPLTPFESRNLPHLLAGDEVRAEGSPDAIRMLGSIRAVTQCLDCHAGPEGRLLGAFSYEIAPPTD